MEFDLDLSIDLLRRSPATLRALLGGLGEPWVRGREGPDTFSPFDVVGHLIDGEETDWIPRAIKCPTTSNGLNVSGHLIDGEETDWIPRARIILARGPDQMPHDIERTERVGAF